LLQDKQGFQLYYGARRLKLYQLKHFASLARRLGQRRKLSFGKVFFHLMENRLEVGLYRLGLVTSLMQSRKLLATHRVKVNSDLVKNFGSKLKYSDIIRIEGTKSTEILARYLKFNVPFFYFRKKEQSRSSLIERKEYAQNNFLIRENMSFFYFLKASLSQLGSLKKKNI
jgi:ribosomal protein S4